MKIIILSQYHEYQDSRNCTIDLNSILFYLVTIFKSIYNCLLKVKHFDVVVQYDFKTFTLIEWAWSRSTR